MTTTDQLAAIEARADAASKGPWDAARGANANGTTYATTYAEKTEFLAVSLNNNKSALWLVASDDVIPAATGDGPRARANAEFIAHARTDVPALIAIVRDQRAAIERVAALHVQEGNGNCVACWDFNADTDVKYPCPTIAALTATEGAE